MVSLGAAWNAGNVGPVVAELKADFDLSLASIGLLSGALLFAPTVAGILVAPRAAERFGVVPTLRLGCALGCLGNLIFAAGESFSGLAAGRVLAGVALGFAAVLGPVYARVTGGVTRVGVFGAGFQLGIAGGLGVGSALVEAGADWRAGFVVSATVALAAIPLLVPIGDQLDLARGRGGFLRAAVGSPQVLRLGLLFTAMFAVPLTLGAWLFHYITLGGGLGAGVAGALSFLMFGISGLMRELGAKLSSRGVSPVVLAGLMPWLAAAGLAAIALDRSFAVVLPAVVLMGAGFALPYAVMMVEAQKLFPPEPAEPTALLSMLGTALPIATIPVMGSVLESGHGEEAFLALAAIVALAAVANLRPAGRPVT